MGDWGNRDSSPRFGGVTSRKVFFFKSSVDSSTFLSEGVGVRAS